MRLTLLSYQVCRWGFWQFSSSSLNSILTESSSADLSCIAAPATPGSSPIDLSHMAAPASILICNLLCMAAPVRILTYRPISHGCTCQYPHLLPVMHGCTCQDPHLQTYLTWLHLPVSSSATCHAWLHLPGSLPYAHSERAFRVNRSHKTPHHDKLLMLQKDEAATISESNTAINK